MKKWFMSLSLTKKTVVISSAVVLFAFLLTIPLFFSDLMEIPLGIILGGGASTLSFLFFALAEKIKDPKESITITILLIILMSVLHAVALILSAILYYMFNLHIFNIFATFGSLFIGLIVHVALSFIPEKQNG